MSKNIQEERLRWVKPLAEGRVRLKDIEKICPYSSRSLKRWKKAYKDGGKEALVPKSTKPKTQPNETPIRVKEEVIALRKKTCLCAQKLHWKLEKQGIVVPVRTIGKILKDEGLVRRYRKKKIQYKYIRAQRQPGELVEIDVKHVPGAVQGRKYYQYTAIDTASRWRHLEVFDQECTHHSIKFLERVIERFPHTIQAIKTDNHATFTNRYNGTYKREDLSPRKIHALDHFCAVHSITHYLIDPGKPAQNGTVERSHREDEEKFYQQESFRNFKDLEKKIRLWNSYYNNLEHCSLDGKTPNEILSKVPNVLA